MRVSLLVLKGATRGCKRVGEWKDIRSDQKVRILGADRMPIHAVGGYCDFRYKVGTGKCDSFGRKSTKGYATDHPVLFADLPTVQKLAELVGLGFCRNRRRQSHPKSFCPRPLNALPRFGPGTRSAMVVVARSGVGLSRLICKVKRSRGNARRISRRRPARSIPLVSMVVGAVAAQAVSMSPMSGSKNGSPPVTKASPTPSASASLSIRRTRSRPSARRGAFGEERTQQ